MKRIIIILISLLSVSASFCTAFAQGKVTANSATEIPAKVSQWINSELAKAKRKTLMDFKVGEFFAKDTARLIGYIKGYSPQAGFSTGMVYARNEVTNEDYPVVVQIHEDGCFECTIPINYPIYSTVFFNDERIDFYIQPGQTLAILLNIDSLQKNVRYLGVTGNINNELFAFQTKLPDIPYEKIWDGRKDKTPEEFKPFLDSCLSDYSRAYQKLLKTEKLSNPSKNILRNNYQIAYATYLFNYETNYMRNHQMPLEFYDFLQDIPMNNKELLSTKDFGTFINRLEFCQPLSIDIRTRFWKKTITSKTDDEPEKTEIIQDDTITVVFASQTDEKKLEIWKDMNKLDYEDCKKKYADFIKKLTPEEIEIERWRLKDSIYANVLKLKPGIVHDVTKIRSLDFLFRDSKNNKEAAWNALTALTSDIPMLTSKKLALYTDTWNALTALTPDIPESFLRREADRLFLKNFPEEQRGAYDLPDTYKAKIFKDLIAPFKGKFLFVDFWATTCVPCVYDIRKFKKQREQYKDSPDIDFIFITSEEESPLQRYNEFVAEQELKNTYRINADQYRYLRQLFRFNVIPHYVLVDKEGRILDNNIDYFTPYGFDLEKLIKK